MCAIVDNNVRDQVFGNNRPGAGEFFFNWLEERGGRLVVGGELLRELSGYSNFTDWLPQAILSGRAIVIPDEAVNAETESLRTEGICRSNDEHVLALARLSGARLLFTNDQALQADFRDRSIVGGVRGRIYTTRERSDIRRSHIDLLRRRDLCDI